MTEPIPADIRQFVLRFVESIAEMEALVILSKSPDTQWTVDELATRLYIPRDEAERVLARLGQHGIAKFVDSRWRFARLHEDDAATVERLTLMYSTHLIAITNLIHSRRGSRIQEFADAFRLRSKD
jgi:transcription initiation factor IIE alpha subunit